MFHAIVPLPYWEWDNKKTRMYIRFGHSKLGKWEENCGEFEVTRLVSGDENRAWVYPGLYMLSFRKIDDIHSEMTCCFDKFNVELLSRTAEIPYKYVVVNSPKVVEKDDCFEYLHAHSKDHGDVNRCLKLSSEKFLRIHRMRE